MVTPRSICRKTSSNQAHPQTTAGSRATTRAVARVVGSISAAVRSPEPRSSASAVATTAGMSAGRSIAFAEPLTTRPRKRELAWVSNRMKPKLDEEAAVTESDHAHQHRNRQHRVDARGDERDAAG